MSAPYRRNKLKTLCEIVRRIENWPTAVGMRLRRGRPGLRLLHFRNGLNIVCRRESRDWDVIHELLFAGGYAFAMNRVKSLSHRPTVLGLQGRQNSPLRWADSVPPHFGVIKLRHHPRHPAQIEAHAVLYGRHIQFLRHCVYMHY